MAIPAKNILGNPNVTEGSFQIAIEQLRESVIGSGKIYDSANTYMAKDTCEYSGVMYYSKIDNNIGNTPSVGANWGDYADLILGAVHKTGDETVAGVKTFSSSPIVPNATTAAQVMAYGQGVNLTATQTVAGVKTFSSSPILPVPTLVNQAISMGNIIEKTGVGIGYGTGSGGTVTQLTSKGTAVSLNKPSGNITMHNASLAAGASVVFELSNSLLTNQDSIEITIDGDSMTVAHDLYDIRKTVRNSSAAITLINRHTSPIAEAVRLNFAIIKGSIN